MLNFDNIEDLVSHMFDNLDDEDILVSVIANKEMTVEIMHELLNYENVILESCEIDFDEEYDREYAVLLLNDIESDKWYVNVEKSYLSEKEKYLSTGGYVLFHEDVNSKAIIDMQNNDFMPLGEHDWFTIGEEDSDNVDDKETDDKEDTDSGYSVTVKCNLDANEALGIIKDMERRMTRIDDMFREMDCFRRLFNW